jgi:two-component system response regulator MprA
MERILVIDDDPSVTSTLRRGLSHEGYIVETANSGDDGLVMIREQTPDLIILDIMMPGLDGLEVLRRLRSSDERLPVLLLTARDSSSDEALGLRYGADDYVVKPFDWVVLMARVNALLRRSRVDHIEILQYADVSIDEGTRQARRGEREFDLTPTEYDLLCEFLRHPERVLPRDYLMDQVWGYQPVSGTNVLETYIKQVRQRLEAAGEPRLIHTIRGVGYILRDS